MTPKVTGNKSKTSRLDLMKIEFFSFKLKISISLTQWFSLTPRPTPWRHVYQMICIIKSYNILTTIRASKYIINRIKKITHKMREMFVNQISDKRLISRIKREHLKLNKQKTT